MVHTPSAGAQVAFPKLARGFGSWMVRAMDQCSPSTLSVTTPGLPTGGCPPTNTVTDDTLGLNFMKLRIAQHGGISLFGTGMTLGDALRVRITLRVTKTGMTTKHPPGTNQTVTFVDQTIDCPKTPDAFLVRPNGSVAGRTDLGACLAPASGLAVGNLEILDVSLVNVMNGRIVAVPGLLR